MKQLKLTIYKAQHSARQKCDAFFYYCEGRGHSFTTGRRKLPPFVFTVATRITPSAPGWMSSTRPRFHYKGGTWSFLINTRVPRNKSVLGLCHLDRCCKVCRYSRCQRQWSRKDWCILWRSCQCERRLSLTCPKFGSGKHVNGAKVKI
jgi:hypothetical protein